MSPISNEPQPEASPLSAQGRSPSLWLYLALLLAAGGLTWLAFAIQGKADWPGLLVNLAAGLVGSVVILVVIDRRLRAQELEAIRRFPTRTTQRLVALILPTRRTGNRYVRSLLVALEPLIVTKVDLSAFQGLEAKVRTGLVLLAQPGQGKTTWTQFVSASLGRKYLQGEAEGRIPILFPLARWLPDRSLHDALYEVFASYAPCSRRLFDRILRGSNVVVLLDGYDELWKRRLPFDDQIKALRQAFPKVAWTLTSRPDRPTPADLGETVSLAAPSEEELDVIRRRKSG